jgi:hypothetical protein
MSVNQEQRFKSCLQVPSFVAMECQNAFLRDIKEPIRAQVPVDQTSAGCGSRGLMLHTQWYLPWRQA